MNKKVEALLARLKEVEEALSAPGITSDQKKFRPLAQEHAFLSDVKVAWEKLQKYADELSSNQALLKIEKDPEFVQVLQDDIQRLQLLSQETQARLENLVIPPGPHDH